MNDNNTQGLRIFYGCEDFDHLWRRIVTNIKIQKFGNLNDVPEFHKLPIRLRNEIRNKVGNMNDYETFSSEQYFNHYHTILFTNENEKWIAIFQEKRLSIHIRALFISILISTLFCICTFFYGQRQKYNNSYKLRTGNDSKDIISYVGNNLFQMALIIIPLGLALYPTRKWLLARESKYNELVEACILRKLRTVTNP